MSEGGVTLVEVMVVVVVLVVVIALLAPAMARSSRQEKVEACAARLKALHAAQESFYGKSTGAAPELGRAYWEKLAKVSPPLIQPQALRCPLYQGEATVEVQYLGPAADPRLAPADDPIGCDIEWNHSEHGQEGGNVLLKSGSVINDNNLNVGGLWGTATRGGKCRP